MKAPPPQWPDDQEAIELLVAMVELYTPSTRERAVADLLVDTMTRWGMDARIDSVGNAVGHIGDGEQQIILLGHMDTAPGRPPVRRESDLLYGRGTVDAKGPLAAFAVAAARAGALPGTRITVIGAVEEEAATSAGAYHAVERYHPAFCIIGEPSGWHRITVGYKGRLLVDYTLERDMSHTAGQERGVCEEAVAFWLHIAGWARAYNADKSSLFDMFDPSLRTMCTTSDGLRDSVEMTIGLRLPLGLDLEELRHNMLGPWRGMAQVDTHAYEQPFRADRRNALTSAFLAAIRAEGGTPAFVTKTGTSDMNVVGPRWGCPIVAYGPGDSGLDHTPGEHIVLSEYLTAVRVLARVLSRLAGESTGN